MRSNYHRLGYMLLGVTILLFIPLIAMQFTDEVSWSLWDFVIMGMLLYGTALVCELILRNIRDLKFRILLCAAAVIVLILIWAELAVGIFGTPFAGS